MGKGCLFSQVGLELSGGFMELVRGREGEQLRGIGSCATTEGSGGKVGMVKTGSCGNRNGEGLLLLLYDDASS